MVFGARPACATPIDIHDVFTPAQTGSSPGTGHP